jgi:hypothetical protein
MNQTGNKRCHGCGGEITPAQIAERKAGLVQGVLLCPECVEEKRRAALQQRAAAQATAEAGNSPPPAASAVPLAAQAVAVPAASPARGDEEDEVISLVSDDEMPTSKSQKIRSFAEGSTLGGAHHDSNLKRALAGSQEGATRIRTFHCKLTDAGLANMDDIINEWLDGHPDIYIKSCTSSLGVFEGGKVKEAHLFICVFY